MIKTCNNKDTPLQFKVMRTTHQSSNFTTYNKPQGSFIFVLTGLTEATGSYYRRYMLTMNVYLHAVAAEILWFKPTNLY